MVRPLLNTVSVGRRARETNAGPVRPLETSPQTQPAACVLGDSESSHADGEDSQGRMMEAYM